MKNFFTIATILLSLPAFSEVDLKAEEVIDFAEGCFSNYQSREFQINRKGNYGVGYKLSTVKGVDVYNLITDQRHPVTGKTQEISIDYQLLDGKPVILRYSNEATSVSGPFTSTDSCNSSGSDAVDPAAESESMIQSVIDLTKGCFRNSLSREFSITADLGKIVTSEFKTAQGDTVYKLTTSQSHPIIGDVQSIDINYQVENGKPVILGFANDVTATTKVVRSANECERVENPNAISDSEGIKDIVTEQSSINSSQAVSR